MYLRLTNGLPNQSFISLVQEFVRFALSRLEVIVITLDVHAIRRSTRIRILLRLTRQGSIFINTVLSIIIMCGICMVKQNHPYMGMRHYIM